LISDSVQKFRINVATKMTPNQGCQIFLDTLNQKEGKYTKLPLKGHKIFQMAVIYSKWPYNIPTLFIPRPSKIYTNVDF
jgi:hypothetical protein